MLPTSLQVPLSGDVHDPEIRILHLHPGDGTISCTLFKAKLSALREKYEALSYCWGDVDRLQPILINDVQEFVTTNLLRALQRLRPTTMVGASRSLWIDALCINQANIAERTSQVLAMRSIFEGCRRVVVWLGESDHGTRRGFEMAARLAHICRTKYNGDTVAATLRYPMSMGGIVGGDAVDVPNFYSSWWVDFFSIFVRPWFKRVWIVQEIAVCPDAMVVCGEFEMPWEDLIVANGMMVTGSEMADNLAIERSRVRCGLDLDEDLASVVVKHRVRLATDPRDKLFALCGLVSERLCYGIAPDYRKEARGLFIEFTHLCIQQSSSLDILSVRGVVPEEYQEFEGTQAFDVPSWVYDGYYNLKYCASRLFAWERQTSTENITFCATNHSKYTTPKGGNVTGKNDLEYLTIRGFVLDQVSSLGRWDPIYSDGAEFPGKRRIYAGLIRKLTQYRDWREVAWINARDSMYEPTGESLDNAFWQTCTAGYEPGEYERVRERYNKFRHHMVPFLYVCNVLQRRCGGAFVELLAPHVGLAVTLLRMLALLLARRFSMREVDWIYDVGEPTMSRRLFKTASKGYIGLGPGNLKEGDCVGLFEGAKVPLLIRRVTTAAGQGKENEGVWTLVGECYLHGVMHGEAWSVEKCKVFQLH